MPSIPGRRPEAEGAATPEPSQEGASGGDTPIMEPELPELPEEQKLPPGVLHIQDGGIIYKILTEEQSDEAVDLLCNHFFKDEPLGKALHLESPRDVDHWLANLLPYIIRHSVSVVAVDEHNNNKIVGVAINSIKGKDATPGLDDFLAWIDPQKDPKIFRIISFLRHVAHEVDFYEKYGVDRIMQFDLLNVSKDYSGRGIAAMLVQQSVALARQENLTCLVALTTGIFSAKIFARHNFRTIREIPYSSHRENGKLVFPSTGIHTSARILVKILQ
ncbi:Acyl-CoA N-acyltransferase [Trinorchestia longiramus]|nr:Acyl-CoA N-acyltransferase [Trinorchestia longiramus]